MKIGFDAKRAFCNHRGLGNYSRSTIAALTRFRPDNDYFLFTPKKSVDYQGLSFPNSKIITPDTLLDKKFPALWRTVRCTKEISQLQLDIFHGLSHELPRGIEKSKTKSVVTMHDLIFLTHPQLYPWIDRKMYGLKYRHSCEIADQIIAISNQTKEDLINYWNITENKIKVVYQGCNPIFYQPTKSECAEEVANKFQLPSSYLLHVGAIEKRKNHELILQAMRQLKENIPLVLVGQSGKYLDELQERFPELFANRIIHLKDVSTEELHSIYANATLFIYPSLYEGFGIPILEAMGSGVPVITTDGKCFKEAGGEACQYISPTHPDQLAAAIASLLNDTEQRKKQILLGKIQIEKFTETSIAAHLSDIYQNIL